MPASFGGKCGYVDKAGKLVISPQFDTALPFEASNGLAIVRLGDQWGLVDRKGNYVVNPQFQSIRPGGYRDIYIVQVAGKSGTINSKGTFVINPQYDNLLGIDKDGHSLVVVGGKVGVVDTEGSYVLQPQFDTIDTSGESHPEIAWLEGRGGIRLGEQRAEPIFRKGLARAVVGTKVGYVNQSGAWVINPQFNAAGGFADNGLALAGITVVTEEPDREAIARNAAAAAEKAAFDAWADENPTDAATAAPWNRSPESTVRQVSKTLYGYIDKTGKFVIKPQFDGAGTFDGSGLAPVRLADLWGYVDAKGAFRINPQFKSANNFVATAAGQLAVVSVEKGGIETAGLIDDKGAFRIQPQFEAMGSFDRLGRSEVVAGGKVGLIDLSGRYVAGPIYNDLSLEYGPGSYFFSRSTFGAAAVGTTEFGFISREGKILRTISAKPCS